MKRFLIHVSTYWCGMDNTFRAVAESEMDLWDLAEQLAYDNFQSYSCENDIAEEEGYDPDEMEESDWDEFSFKDIVETFEKAESISEEEKDTICQLFGDSRGLTFTDEVLDIIGIRNV